MRRVLTALALLAAGVYLVLWAPKPVFMGAACLIAVLCYWEFRDLVSNHGISPPDVLGIVAGLAVLYRPEKTLIVFAVLIVLVFARSLRLDNVRAILPHVSSTALGTIYTFAPWRMARDLRDISVHLLLFALALSWAGDSAAFYVGRRFGKHRLAPVISPGKSWEGAAASLAGSLVFGIFYLGYFAPQIATWRVVVMAIAGNVAGQMGDLAESAMKRGAQMKDSGQLLPGHGGILDRVDSSLFALPIVYLLLLLTSL